MVAAILVVAGLVVVPAPAAQAHGALASPISRALACDSSSYRALPACQAAIKAGSPTAMGDWDDVRVADVAGRDRSVIPDEKLCSAGIEAFHGLDLARDDWPATTLTAGAAYRFSFRTTIPHRGTFRLYITRDGYRPTENLRWSDLEATPFVTATDPPVNAGAYVFSGRLPAGKAGRHLIYTIWQTSNTPDTYYTCSDVVFAPPATIGPTSSAPAPATSQPGAPSPDGSAAPIADGPPAASPTGDAAAYLAAALTIPGLAVLIALIAYVRRRRPARTDRRHPPR
jgi:predicted carbohydrate-binding protein with CBM5 and CBM33 domain